MRQMGWREVSVCLGPRGLEVVALGRMCGQLWGLGGGGTEVGSPAPGTNSRCSFKVKPGRTGEPMAGTAGRVLRLAEMGKVGPERLPVVTHGAPL